ncbi:ABC transporter substrate-binding protein [Curtobacterium sp. MCJR17_043]|uniref:ABC transporter substrate-binding protein n=1 Tax=Curtobacterium sp. MCJR17_043 TaxID=2175660 RepID=UPI0032E8F49F
MTPLLAKSYDTSSDGLTYTFTLRKGVQFHSGAELTSADVKSSIERVTAEDSQSSRKSSLAVVESIETPDDETVVVHLSQRSISFVYNLSYVWIVPAGGDEAQDRGGRHRAVHARHLEARLVDHARALRRLLG